MSERVEITRGELELVLEALDDAAFYRETRSRVLQSAARKLSRRSAVAPTGADGPSDAEGHRLKSQAYGALAAKLKRDL
jgi:hypothetical protein